MSEEKPYGSVATQEKPTSPPAEAPASRSSRAVLLAAGVAGLVLAVFAYILFGTGGDPEASLLVVVPPVASPAAPPPADAEGASTTQPADAEGRNPFTPLLVEAPPKPAEPAPAPSASQAPGAPVVETVTITVVSVKGDTVSAKVGAEKFTDLQVGDTFGTSFQVYAIFNESCAGFLYGDDSFALCENSSVSLAKG